MHRNITKSGKKEDDPKEVYDESGLFLREDLRTIYEATMTSRIDFRTRIWETFATAAVTSAGLVAGIGGLAGGLLAEVGGVVPRPVYFFFLGTVLLVMAAMLACGLGTTWGVNSLSKSTTSSR